MATLGSKDVLLNRSATLKGLPPVINQRLVRFLDRHGVGQAFLPVPSSIRDSSPTSLPVASLESTATEEADDRRTDEVIAAIQKTGEAFFGAQPWRGRRAMRVSVCNWQTSDEDVERVVKAVASVLTSDR